MHLINKIMLIYTMACMGTFLYPAAGAGSSSSSSSSTERKSVLYTGPAALPPSSHHTVAATMPAALSLLTSTFHPAYPGSLAAADDTRGHVVWSVVSAGSGHQDCATMPSSSSSSSPSYSSGSAASSYQLATAASSPAPTYASSPAAGVDTYEFSWSPADPGFSPVPTGEAYSLRGRLLSHVPDYMRLECIDPNDLQFSGTPTSRIFTNEKIARNKDMARHKNEYRPSLKFALAYQKHLRKNLVNVYRHTTSIQRKFAKAKGYIVADEFDAPLRSLLGIAENLKKSGEWEKLSRTYAKCRVPGCPDKGGFAHIERAHPKDSDNRQTLPTFRIIRYPCTFDCGALLCSGEYPVHILKHLGYLPRGYHY